MLFGDFAYILLFVIIAAIPILIIVGIALIGMVVVVNLICRIVRIILVRVIIQLRLRVSVSRYPVTFSHGFVLLSSVFVEYFIYCLNVAVK